jgi:hypothetical protein
LGKKKIKAGTIAGSHDRRGYLRIRVYGRIYRAGRLAWLLMTGCWPTDQIGHKNRDPSDNRWGNLREASAQLNARNQSLSKRNTTGFVGVDRGKKNGTYRATIVINGRKIHLGIFPTLEEAVAARRAANQRYGFSQGHGSRRRKPKRRL